MTMNKIINEIKKNGFCVTGEKLYTDDNEVYKQITPKDESILTELQKTNFENFSWLIENPKICYDMYNKVIDENASFYNGDLQFIQLNDYYEIEYHRYIYFNNTWYSEVV